MGYTVEVDIDTTLWLWYAVSFHSGTGRSDTCCNPVLYNMGYSLKAYPAHSRAGFPQEVLDEWC